MPQSAVGKARGEPLDTVTSSRLPTPAEVLAKLNRGQVGPEEIQQARDVLPVTTDRSQMLQISRYVLSVQPETYTQVLEVMRSHPEQQKLADTIHAWSSELDAESRRLLMMFLMAAEPDKADSTHGRLDLLRLGIFCGSLDTQKVLGARVAHELIEQDLTAEKLLHESRRNLSAWAALGGAPLVLASVAARAEHPVLRERLLPFEQRARSCQGTEAHELLKEAQDVIDRFKAHESEARAHLEPRQPAMLLERDEMVLVGGTVLRKKA